MAAPKPVAPGLYRGPAVGLFQPPQPAATNSSAAVPSVAHANAASATSYHTAGASSDLGARLRAALPPFVSSHSGWFVAAGAVALLGLGGALVLRRAGAWESATYYGERDEQGRPHGMGVRLSGEALSSAASASASASAAAGAGGEVIARQCGRWEHGKLVEERAVPLTYLPPNAPLPSRAAGAAQIYPFGTCWTGAVDAAGQAYGPGLMHRADGAQFLGTFTADTLNGPGSARWPDGAKYTGDFKEGAMHGVGAFTFPDGKIYAGQFEHDAPQGLGVQWSAVGKGKNAVVVELMGRWAGGEMAQMGPIPTAPIASLAQIKGALPLKVLPTGSGIRNSSLLLPNGGWYKGRYSTASYPYVPDTSSSSTAGGAADETGQPASAANADDVGTLFDPSGAEVARGSWRNGVQEGVGSISLNGDRFEGHLRGGAPHGEGVMRFAGNGCAFEGQWDEGRSRGFGVQWGPQGQLLQCGRWDAGALVERRPVPLACLPQKLFLSPLCAASASLLFPDGGFYVGATRTDPTSKKLKELQRHGEGTMYTPDGRVQRQGFWEADLPIAAPPKADDKA